MSEELSDLERTLLATQELLAHVLMEVGEDVFIPKSSLEAGFPAGMQIKVEEDLEGDGFVLGLEFPQQ